MCNEDFVYELGTQVPELQPIISDHLEYFEELLIHLLMSDILRFATEQFGQSSTDVASRVLAVVDVAHRLGDDRLQNAVAVSFVEHFGAWPGETDEFLATWPSPLREELERQRNG